MPDPSTLAEYEKVIPGSAERILRTIEAGTTDQSARDDKIVEASTWVQKTGAGWAFFLLFSCVLAAIVFFALGKNQAGITLLAAPAVVALLNVLRGLVERPKD